MRARFVSGRPASGLGQTGKRGVAGDTLSTRSQPVGRDASVRYGEQGASESQAVSRWAAWSGRARWDRAEPLLRG